jgi:hypothetical protein
MTLEEKIKAVYGATFNAVLKAVWGDINLCVFNATFKSAAEAADSSVYSSMYRSIHRSVSNSAGSKLKSYDFKNKHL